jgi:hypothetical protein
MSLALALELRVEERREDRVVVSVLLAPATGPARLDGVALQLHTRTGEPLGAQVLLPIAGALHQPMVSTVELRAGVPIPLGCRVVGTAWHGQDQREAMIPTDPFTELEVHMRARRRILPSEDSEVLERLLDEDRVRIARDFPWVDEPRIPREPAAELTVVDHQDPEDESYIDDIVDDLGLDGESSAWLKDLLQEP